MVLPFRAGLKVLPPHFVQMKGIRVSFIMSYFTTYFAARRLVKNFCLQMDKNLETGILNANNCLYSIWATQDRVDVVDQICGSDYIEGWMACFELLLADRGTTVLEFLARCSHFTVLVREFNANYVIKTQRALEKSLAVPEHNIDDFEDFRERFGLYLHEVEQWAERIARETEKRVPGDEYLRYVPQRTFERAKSFKKKTASTVGA